jgi:hypothetical protein
MSLKKEKPFKKYFEIAQDRKYFFSIENNCSSIKYLSIEKQLRNFGITQEIFFPLSQR